MKKTKSSRGVVLINVIILLLIMIFVAGMCLQMSLGRYEQVARHRTSLDSTRMAQSVREMLEACLANQQFATLAANACNPPFANWSASAPMGACGGGNGRTTTLNPFQPIPPAPGPQGFTYNFSVTWCDPAGAGNGALTITCNPGACGNCGC